MELFTLNRQWSTRPADQRFTSLTQVLDVTRKYAEQAKVKEGVKWGDLRVEAAGDDLNLVGKANVPATLTNYAFGQLASRVGAPAHYLRALPATLAAQNLNHGLKNNAPATNDAQLLFHQNGRLVLRAVTTDVYSRLWNFEVVERLLGFADKHQLVPVRPTFNWDNTPRVNDPNSEAALYASDHDMVLGLMSKDKAIYDGNSALYRVMIVKNSEVGDAGFSAMLALVRDICGNFILWGVSRTMEISFPHVGKVGEKFTDMALKTVEYLNSGTGAETRMIEVARNTIIAKTRDEVLDELFGKRAVGLSKRAIGEAYDAAIPAVDGDPNTVWGFVQGLTRRSQAVSGQHADERLEMDKAARRVLAQYVEF